MATPIITAIALDLGTTSIKAGLLDSNGTLSNIVAQPAPGITVNGGRYESDARSYAQTAELVLGECLNHAGGSPPLGLCSQRSSFLIWERASGLPLTPLISWQDNRGAASCDELRNSEGLICDFTGLRLTPYYFATKLRVMLQDRPEWRARLERGELLVGTLDTFLIWRWTGGKYHVTDASMAARTLLMDIRQQQWSPTLCELFGIPVSILPRITTSAGMNLPIIQGLTLQASLGDQSAALIASVGNNNKEALVNLGTGGFVVRYLTEGISMQDGYLRTLVYQDSKKRAHFAIEGTLNSLAAALAPYPADECCIEDLATDGITQHRDAIGAGMPSSCLLPQSAGYASNVSEADDIFCLAEPSGLGAPYFRNDFGICFSRSTEHLTPRQIASLLLEGIIFRVARILEDFHRASAIERIYLSGGLSELTCLQQGIAQCAPCDVYRLRQKDSSLQGAALLAAGMASNYPKETEKIEVMRNAPFLPEKYRRWKDWFDALLGLS
jgi:glycerol kinase